MGEQVLYYYERCDKKIEVAINFIKDLRDRAERQGKNSFVKLCDKKINEINLI